MEFEDEKKNTSDLLTIGLVLAGLAILYFLFKKPQQQVQSQQAQSIQSIQSQQYNDPYSQYNQYQPLSRYENAENWEVLRGEDGFISNVRALRDATVGNGIASTYSSHDKNIPSSNIDNYIDNRVKEMMRKNLEEMKRYNQRFVGLTRLSDRDRSAKFGFA